MDYRFTDDDIRTLIQKKARQIANIEVSRPEHIEEIAKEILELVKGLEPWPVRAAA